MVGSSGILLGYSMADCLSTGWRLGHYEIRRTLAQDAGGFDYEATHATGGGAVLVKEYLPGATADRLASGRVVARSSVHRGTLDAGVARFAAGYRTLARLDHPAIAGVRSVVETNGTCYAVIDLQAWPTLARRLEENETLAESELRAFAHALFDGLEAVHRAGLLHGAIRPHNILLKPDGTPQLGAFSPLPVRSGGSRRAFGGATTKIDTPPNRGYSAPEQYPQLGGGSPQGPWTDVYALGAVLHRCVYGAPPDAPQRASRDAMAVPTARSAYSQSLLDGIDVAVAPRIADRPRDIAALRARLGLSPTDSTSRRRPLRDDTRASAALPGSPGGARPVMARARGENREEPTRHRPGWVRPVMVAVGFIALLTWMDTAVLRTDSHALDDPQLNPVDVAPPATDAASAPALRPTTATPTSRVVRNPRSRPSYKENYKGPSYKGPDYKERQDATDG